MRPPAKPKRIALPRLSKAWLNRNRTPPALPETDLLPGQLPLFPAEGGETATVALGSDPASRPAATGPVFRSVRGNSP